MDMTMYNYVITCVCIYIFLSKSNQYLILTMKHPEKILKFDISIKSNEQGYPVVLFVSEKFR